MRRERFRPRLDQPEQAAHHLGSMASSEPSPQPSLLVVVGDRDASPLHHVEIMDCAADPSPSECALVLG